MQGLGEGEEAEEAIKARLHPTTQGPEPSLGSRDSGGVGLGAAQPKGDGDDARGRVPHHHPTT